MTMRIGTATIVAPIDLMYVREWACHNLRLGMSDMWMGLNDFTDEELLQYHRTMADLIQERRVHPFRIDGKGMQLPCNNQSLCLANSTGIDWLFLIDIDEFLKIRSSRTLDQILEDHQGHPAVSIHWRLFGSSGQEHQAPFPVQERFTRCEANLNRHLKTGVNLKWFRDRGLPPPVSAHPHFVNATTFSIDGRPTFGPFEDIELNRPRELELSHYAVKSKDECMVRRSYRRCDVGIPRQEGWESFFKAHDKNDIESSEIESIKR